MNSALLYSIALLAQLYKLLTAWRRRKWWQQLIKHIDYL